MSETGATARFFNGTTFGKYHFAVIPGTKFGDFIDTTTKKPVVTITLTFVNTSDEMGGFADVDLDKLVAVLSEFGPIGCGCKNQQATAPIALPAKEKPRFIEVVRYCRPLYMDIRHDLYGNIISNQGVTFYFVLDYQEKEVRFGYSVCNGDNFEKRMGRDLAKDMYNNPETQKKFPMIDGKVGNHGLIYDLLSTNRHLLDPECRRQMKNYFNWA
jgi:hypothetical protein